MLLENNMKNKISYSALAVTKIYKKHFPSLSKIFHHLRFWNQLWQINLLNAT